MSPCSWTQLVKACTGSPHLHFEKKMPMERISFLWSPRHLLLFGQRWKSPKSRSFSNRAKVAISFTQKAHVITQVGIDWFMCSSVILKHCSKTMTPTIHSNFSNHSIQSTSLTCIIVIRTTSITHIIQTLALFIFYHTFLSSFLAEFLQLNTPQRTYQSQVPMGDEPLRCLWLCG